MTTTYGYYYEEGLVQGESPDVWALIEQAVAEDPDQLHLLRVGEMREASVDDYLTDDDVAEMREEERLTPEWIQNLVNDWHADSVVDGTAECDLPGADLSRMTSAAVVDWAREHITLDPTSYCDGYYPLPIQWHEGKWHFGQNIDPKETLIDIEYTDGKWWWYSRQQFGTCETLREAMAACEAAIKEVVGCDSLSLIDGDWICHVHRVTIRHDAWVDEPLPPTPDRLPECLAAERIKTAEYWDVMLESGQGEEVDATQRERARKAAHKYAREHVGKVKHVTRWRKP